MGVIKETAKKTGIDREQLDLAVHALALATNPKMRKLTASKLAEMKEWEFLARILLDDLRLVDSLKHQSSSEDVGGDVWKMLRPLREMLREANEKCQKRYFKSLGFEKVRRVGCGCAQGREGALQVDWIWKGRGKFGGGGGVN